MGIITDKQMQAAPAAKDIWMIEDGARGTGRFVARITPGGERLFYFRYADAKGGRVRLPLGAYDAAGRSGLTLRGARERAAELSRLHQSGVRDLREHLDLAVSDAKQRDADARREAAEARRKALEDAQAAKLARRRRITVRELFDRWAATELAPHTRTDGKRTGRKDGGESARAHFERRVFPDLGDVAAADIKKVDLMTVLDTARAAGQLRTANVLLSELKQMFRFGLTRELVERNVLETVTKRDAGGPNMERDRVLSIDELDALFKALPRAALNKRSSLAVPLILGTACRVGELMAAEWTDIDLTARTWHLPDTKNQRPHTVHLSDFTLRQFEHLAELRETGPWVFPNSSGKGPVDSKSFGKQLADRQRLPEDRLQGRSKATTALQLAGGRWTAHDLRRTAATLMASLGVSGDVIDECLNHVIESRVRRTYIRDRRPVAQARAFDALGARLQEIFNARPTETNVVELEGRRVGSR
ncbi:MAG: tyrosine-type recombinase/integrase [Pseudomonadota bacterium]